MSFCFVCGSAQGAAILWRAAAEAAEDAQLVPEQLLPPSVARPADGYAGPPDLGRLNYELGLSPCCGRQRAEGLRARLARRAAAPPPAAAPVDDLSGARLLLTAGAGLDRSFLDGLAPGAWVRGREVPTATGTLQLSSRAVEGPRAAARHMGPQGASDTLAEVRLDVCCRLTCGAEVEERTTRVSAQVPAPVGGYIEAFHPQRGGRLCVALRCTSKANEVDARSLGAATEASVLLAATQAGRASWRPRRMRLRVRWRGSEARSASLLPPTRGAASPQEVPLAHALRALLGLGGAAPVADVEAALSIFKAAVRRRTPPTFSAGGCLTREALFERLVDDLLSAGVAAPTTEPELAGAQSTAASLRRGDAGEPPHLPQVLALVGGAAAAEPAESAAVEAADAVDVLARLFCAALRPRLCPGVEEPAEQAMDLLAPCAVSAAALRGAQEDLVYWATREVQAALAAPAAPQAPPCLGKGALGTPRADAAAAGRFLLLSWPEGQEECPLCGTQPAEGAHCAVCAADFAAEAELCELPEGAVRSELPPFELRRGGGCWWMAPRTGLLRGLTFGARAPLAVRNALARRFAAAEVQRTLRLRMLQRLKGPGAGVKATEPVETKGVLRRRAPCLLSEDRGLHDATMSSTGLRSSQIHSAHGRRRACKRKLGAMCLHLINEKTPQQTRACPPSVLFAPSALEDEEDERAAVEAAQAAVKRARHEAPSCHDFVRVTVEGAALAGRARQWKRHRALAGLGCQGDEVLDAPDVVLGLEQALRLPRLVREELDCRLGDFRVGEEALLPDGQRAQVGARAGLSVLTAAGRSSLAPTMTHTLGRRLPRPGDEVPLGEARAKVAALESLEVRLPSGEARQVPADSLRKVTQRTGDPAWLPPLAYVNAVLAERQGHVNLRLQGGHTSVLVQRQPLTRPEGDDMGAWAMLFGQLRRGELGLWHVDSLAGEEHLLPADGDQRMAAPPPPASYTLPLGERQLHCARALALPPPPGHPVRQGPLLRALLACCSAWREHCGDMLRAPPALSHLVQASAFGTSGSGAGAHFALFAVVLIDEVDGTSYEDAGSTPLNFGREQGRCFLLTARASPRTRSRVLTLAELRASNAQELKEGRPGVLEHELRHLDASGRAAQHSFVLKGTPLAHLRDGTRFLAPYDAWVEAWGTTRRGTAEVLLAQEHGWESGMKVVGLLQKSVLSAVANSLWAPVPVSFQRAEVSCVSRNAPATYVSSLALRLLLARGLRLDSAPSRRRLAALAALFLAEDCSLARVRAARALTWGLCLDDCYPVLLSAQGRRAGVARVLLQEMGIPLDKAAMHVVTLHAGGEQRRGTRLSQGQSLECMEREVTRVRDPTFPGGEAYDASRPALSAEAARPEMMQAWRSVLSLLNCAMCPTGN